jgi:hypothetical protein
MEVTQDFVSAFNRAIYRESAGSIKVSSNTVASTSSWFPSLKVDNVTMIGWSVVMKYRPHNSGSEKTHLERKSVEIEVTIAGRERHPKMVANEVAPVIVNPLAANAKYAFAHIPLTTPLRLDVPFEDQREVFKEIVEHTKTLTDWYRKSILGADF